MARYLMLTIGVLTAFGAFATDSYLCVADLTTGFVFDRDKKEWERAHFRSDEKFIISKSSQKTHAWEVKQVGSDYPLTFCEKDFTDGGNLYCEGVYDIRFNRKNLRFLYFYNFGYWDEGVMVDVFPDSKEGDNTPAIAIGKCSPL